MKAVVTIVHIILLPHSPFFYLVVINFKRDKALLITVSTFAANIWDCESFLSFT